MTGVLPSPCTCTSQGLVSSCSCPSSAQRPLSMPLDAGSCLSLVSQLTYAHSKVRICCSLYMLISTNLYICSDQQQLSRVPRGYLRAESPFQVQQGREKNGRVFSVPCCSRGARAGLLRSEGFAINRPNINQRSWTLSGD